MKKTFILLACLTILATTKLTSQNLYSKVLYHNYFPLNGHVVINTHDNGFLVGGNFDSLPMITKLDDNGNLLWSKTYGNEGDFYCATVTSDSCYVFAGDLFNPYDSMTNIFCVKINSSGDTLWTKEINVGKNDYALSIQQTNEKGFILSGFTTTDAYQTNYDGNYYLNFFYYPHFEMLIVNIDSTGNTKWTKTISAGVSSALSSIKQISDSEFVAIGCINELIDSIHIKQKFIILKTDSIGNIDWLKKDNTGSKSYGGDILILNDGLLFYTSYDGKTTILKTDFSGNIVKSYQFDADSYFINDFVNLLGKFKESSYKDYYLSVISNYYILKIDSSGNIANSFSYFQMLSDFTLTSDSGLFIIGSGPLLVTKYYIPAQIGIIKADSLGNAIECGLGGGNINSTSVTIDLVSIPFTESSTWNVEYSNPVISNVDIFEKSGCVDIVGQIEQLTSDNAFSVFPNPSSGTFKIKFNNALDQTNKYIEIYNSLGQKVFASSQNSDVEITVQMRNQPEGIYFISVKAGDQMYKQKISIIGKE